MDILSEQELAAKVNFARPLKEPPEERESLWNIPFEPGNCPIGTRISVSKAREISAELRALVAEAEKRELLRYFKKERDRADQALRESAEWQQKFHEMEAEVVRLNRRKRPKK